LVEWYDFPFQSTEYSIIWLITILL
jgi:hypothetical protein